MKIYIQYTPFSQWRSASERMKSSNKATGDTSNVVQQLVRLALHMRRNGQTLDPRYQKVVALLKQHHMKTPQLVRETMDRVSAEQHGKGSLEANRTVPPVASSPHPYFEPQTRGNSLFTMQQLDHLRRQIEMFKTLSNSMTQLLQTRISKGSAASSGTTEIKQQVSQGNIMSSNVAATKVQDTQPPATQKNDLSASTSDANVPPTWKRRDRNLVYFGPSRYDGNNILGVSGETPFLILDLQAVYDERALRHRPGGTSAEHVRKIQHDLRRQVLEAYENNLCALGEPLLIDRQSFRRSRPQSRDEIRDSVRDARKKHIQRENIRRQKHQVYLRAVVNHSRDFFSFHKGLQANIAKISKAAKGIIDQKIQRAEREEDKQEKLRLKALKANDMEAYTKLVAEAKNERLTYLLEQTDHYLNDIRALVRKHREKHRLGGHGGDLDYLDIAQRGELPRQPQMLVGGDLKEYQLRGLQWMASLYDNRLN